MLLRALPLLALLLLSAPSGAHLLKIDRDIGVLMHVDPDDAPVANEKAVFFIEIKDRSNRFVAERCDCRLVVSEQEKVLFSAGILAAGKASAPSYIFAEAGIYRVEVTGKPIERAAFQAFSVPFELRVESGQGTSAGLVTQYWPVWAVLIAALAAFLFALRGKRAKVKS